jgi:hypothetical protein
VLAVITIGPIAALLLHRLGLDSLARVPLLVAYLIAGLCLVLWSVCVVRSAEQTSSSTRKQVVLGFVLPPLIQCCIIVAIQAITGGEVMSYYGIVALSDDYL